MTAPDPAEPVVRDLGEQPVARLLAELSLKHSDVVSASAEHITHKMVARACKGRRLTPHVQAKIVRAVNGAAAGRAFTKAELFNY